MALAAAALALPLRQFTDQDYLDPPWQHDLDSGLWHARRGSLPGRWDARQANPPPPPVTSPPPWWAVGVGGDGEYDWNVRERDWEYSPLPAEEKQLRGVVSQMVFNAASLYFDSTTALHLLECTAPACRLRGIRSNVTWSHLVREPFKLRNGVGEGNDPAADSTYIPGYYSVDEARHIGATVGAELYKGTPADNNPAGLDFVAKEREAEREQMGLGLLPTRDHTPPWDEGADECEDNDALVQLAFAGGYGGIEDCATLLDAANRHGVECDVDLRPFGVQLNSIQTACPKACGACRTKVGSFGARGADPPEWHKIGEIGKFYADVGEYLLYMETAFLKLEVYCDGLDGARCDGWERMEPPGADIAYDRFAHFFVGRAKQESRDKEAARDFLAAAEQSPPPPASAPGGGGGALAQLASDADEGATTITLDDAAAVAKGDTLRVGVYYPAETEAGTAALFGGDGGDGGDGGGGGGGGSGGGATFRSGYGTEDAVVRSVSGASVVLEKATSFPHEAGDLVAVVKPATAAAPPRKKGFFAMLRPRTEKDKPHFNEGTTTRMLMRPKEAPAAVYPAAALAPFGARPLSAANLSRLELDQALNASHGALTNVSCDMTIPFCLSHPEQPCPCDVAGYGAPQPDRVVVAEEAWRQRDHSLTPTLQPAALPTQLFAPPEGEAIVGGPALGVPTPLAASPPSPPPRYEAMQQREGAQAVAVAASTQPIKRVVGIWRAEEVGDARAERAKASGAAADTKVSDNHDA